MTMFGVSSLLRSVLFVPGTRPDRFPKAMAAGADAVVFDLEDGVEAGRKAEARQTIGEWLASSRRGRPGATRARQWRPHRLDR